ncbi:MAG: glycosyltransferase family 9 protein [Elusimicrobia bacterium]|nr:glycosyltransferase family 9 protein [Elusimicrobiota bacterium]
MTGPEHVLIYRCGAIGDTIVAIPAIRAIREHYPGARFLLMTASGGEGIVWTDRVLREFNWFDDVITYETSEISNPLRIWGVLGRVRRGAPDIVFYLASEKNSRFKILRDRFFFHLAGARRFIPAYSGKVTLWGRLNRAPRLYVKETDRLLAELARQGIPAPTAMFDLPITPRHSERVTALLKESGLDPSRPLVGMCPGSKQPIKVWPAERFVEVGLRLIQEEGVNIVIVGGSDEAAVGAQLMDFWPAGRAANLAQKLSILESAELLRRCLFYLGNDTGAMHLAAAVGTRCVAIFAAREPARSWDPYGDNHAILRKSVPCQNCYLRECVKQGLRCLKDITVEEVWAACRRMLIYR